MRLIATAITVMVATVATPVWAASEPIFAPRGNWVDETPLPAPDPALAKSPIQALLVDSQTRFGSDGLHEFHSRSAQLIQTPEGLGAVGTIALPWNPELSDLVIHQVAILRGGKTIDVLAGGAKFTTLRRENNLEQAMLDGTLTAVLQPEGLSVGDTLLLSYTIRGKPASVRLAPEQFSLVPPALPFRHARWRAIWPKDQAIRWRASPAIGAPKLRDRNGVTEFTAELRDVKLPLPPARAPARFLFPATIQLTGYADWPAVSRTIAPLYERASALQPGSPLKAEADRIMTAHSDPAARTLAALRLVQDQVRYVALGMGEGGYVPASAEQTWARKFGDCKGKTVTLLALLGVMGMPAEPLLVSSRLGDALGEQLPQVGLFDHVLVRVTVAGKAYLIDGTRSGDRRLDTLGSFPFGHALPLRAAGADLERLAVAPPAEPLTEINVTYDASKGYLGSVPVKSELIFRGDLATAYRLAADQIGKDELEKQVRESFDPMIGAPKNAKFAFRSDEAKGSFTISFDGAASMNWRKQSGNAIEQYRFSDYVISWDADLKRDAGAGQDAPFALAFPVYMTSRETVILPNGGDGFRIEGKPLGVEIAGTAIRRDLVIANGRAVATSSFRRIRNEVSAAEAKAAAEPIAAVNKDAAYLRAPSNYRPSRAELDTIVADDPKSASNYLERGYRLLGKGQNKAALADFRQASALDPKNGRAAANAGVALVHLGKFDEAKVELDKALALEPDDFVVHQGLGLLHLENGELDKAVAAFTRSLELDADNVFTLGVRFNAQARLGRFELAMADADRVRSIQPDNQHALLRMAEIAELTGDRPAALAALRELQKHAGDSFELHARSGALLRGFGLAEEADAAYDRALTAFEKSVPAEAGEDDRKRERAGLLMNMGRFEEAVTLLNGLIRAEPNSATLLNNRCWARALAGVKLDQALADCNRALELRPENGPALDSRGFVKLRQGRLDAAIADFDAALRLAPTQAASLYGRAHARLRKGDRAGADADVAAARRLVFDIDLEFRKWGLSLEPATKTAVAIAD